MTKGLREVGRIATNDIKASQPAEVSVETKTARARAIYVRSDFPPFLEDAVHTRLLLDIALRQAEGDHTIILLSHQVTIPSKLERCSARYKLSVPDRDALRELVLEEAQS